MLIRFTISILALLLFWSCEEVVDLDVDFEPQVVVVSEIAPNRPATVTVSRSRPILSQSSTEFVVADQVTITNRSNGTVVDLYLQEEIKDSLNPDSDFFPFYFSGVPEFVRDGNNYELDVVVDEENSISAITTIPPQVSIQSLNLLNFSANEDPRAGQVYDINFDFSFIHAEHKSSNYHLVFYFRYIVPVAIEADTVLYYYTQIPAVNDLVMDYPYTFDFENGVLIQGHDIPEGNHSIEGNLSVSYEDNFSRFTPELLVELRNTSTNYHNYHFNLSRQQSQRDSILSQAILIPSNVSNGLGIFGGYNFDIKSVRLTN